MNDESEILAAKVLAGEASEREKAELRALLSAHPELQQEFKELEAADESLRESRHIMDALDAAPAAIPGERRRQLEKAVEAKFGRSGSDPSSVSELSRNEQLSSSLPWWHWLARRWRAWVAALAAVLVAHWILNRPNKLFEGGQGQVIAYLILEQGQLQLSDRARGQATGLVELLRPGQEVILNQNTRATAITPDRRVTLVGPRRLNPGELLQPPETSQRNLAERQRRFRVAVFDSGPMRSDSGVLRVTRAAPAIPLYSPLGATASLNPLLLWKAEPGKTYDLTVSDALDSTVPPWRASAIVPPLAFTNTPGGQDRALIPDNLYRVRIEISGQPRTASTYTFRTTETASITPPLSDSQKLLEASDLLASSGSARLGDALADLMTLAAPLSTNELVLRLKLFAFGEAGYREDFEETAGKLFDKN